MKLKKFLLRYYPPGIILEYQRNNGEPETKSIDLLNLTEEYSTVTSTNVDELVDDILQEEPLIPANKRGYLVELIHSTPVLLELQAKMLANKVQEFGVFKRLKAHQQPLTNCAFNKGGEL